MVLVNRSTALRDPELLSRSAEVVSEDFAFFSSVYPHFNAWFTRQVLPGVLVGERTLALEERNGQVVAFFILKHTVQERKLCTLRVRDGLQNRGLGLRLFERAFDILLTDKPLLSVADAKMPSFTRIVRYFGFEIGGAYRDLYRPESVEFAFNGELVSPATSASVPAVRQWPVVSASALRRSIS